MRAGISANISDLQSIAIITPNPGNDLNSLKEKVVSILASGTDATEINTTKPTGYNVTNFSEEETQLFSIETSPDISDVTFALVSRYDPTNQILDEKNLTISCENSATVSIEKPSNSIYDSKLHFEVTANNETFSSTTDEYSEVCYPTDIDGTIPNTGKWTATFDNTSNVNLIRAIHSEHNVYDTTTKKYTRPLRVSNYDTFNKKYALGHDLLNETQHYFTENATTSEPTPNEISEIYTLKYHDLVAEKVVDTFDNISLNDCGRYKIELNADIPAISIINEELDENTNTSNLNDFPLFESKKEESLPLSVDYSKFASLFDLTKENIVPGYKFTVTIEEQSKSGYSPNSDMTHESDSQNTFILNDENLVDNAAYMDKFVNGAHSVTITNGDLSIEAQTEDDNADNISFFTLDGSRETLSAGLFNHGEIKVNNRSVTGRANIVDNGLGLTASVYYSGEDVNRESITSVERTNSYVNYDVKLIAKNSDITPAYLKSNKCSFDLFDKTDLIGDKFLSVKSNFRFDATSYSSDFDMNILKIQTNRKLASIDGIKSINMVNGSMTLTPLTPLDRFSTDVKIQNVSLLADNNVFNNAKIMLQLRDLTDLSIYNAITNTNNWSIVSTHGTKVASSSESATGDVSSRWPSFDATLSCINGNDIDYTIMFSNASTGQLNTGLKDKIIINWSLRNTSASYSFVIPQEMMTRIEKNSNINNQITDISSDQYILTGIYQNKTNYVLKKVVTSRKIQYNFDLFLRVFIGLEITTPEIDIQTTYYKLVNTNTGEPVSSLNLKYVKRSDNILADYSGVEEIHGQLNTISGSLTSSDFLDLTMHVEGRSLITNNNVNLSAETPVSSMYGVSRQMELIYENEPKVGDIIFSMHHEYLSESGEEGYGILDNTVYGYQIQLTNVFNTEYTVENWSSNTATNFTTGTNIEDINNPGSLSIDTCYSGITTWSSDYSIDVSYSGTNNSTTTLKIYKTNDTQKTKLFSIEIDNFTYIIPNMFISCIANDVFKISNYVGNSETDLSSSSSKFVTVDYTYQKDSNTSKLSNIIKLGSGVYLSKPVLNKNTLTLDAIGKSTEITLKGDLFGANLIGSVAEMNELKYVSSENTGLVFQYNDVAKKHASQTLTITGGYRGYKGTQNVDQSYTLTRTKTTAKFSIENGENGTIYQDFDVYYNSEYTIDSLTDGTEDFVTIGFGLKIKFLMSMDNNLEITTMPIYLLPDNVSVTIVNPEAIGEWNRAPANTSNLKSFKYTFSANNFTIAPKRIKIRTEQFDYSKVAWVLELKKAKLSIYKNNNYLGNPENITIANWTEINTNQSYTYNNLYDGKGISLTSKWVIKKSPDLTTNNTEAFIAYCVLMPTYTLFQQVCDKTLTIPYTFSTSQLTSKYLPFSIETKLNPFASVTNANNITFEKITSETMATIVSNGKDTNFIVVEANKIKILLNIDGISDPIKTVVDGSLPINRLMYLNDTSNIYMPTDGLTSTKSGITMKVSQPIITNTPYSPLTASSDLFSVSTNTNGNISFKISNFFLPSGSFDLGLPCGSGTKVRLVTRQIVNSGDNIEMIVYNYTGLNNYSTDNVDYDTNGSNNITLYFNDRSYKKKTISSASFNQFLKDKVSEDDIINGKVYDKFIVDQSIGFADGTALDSSWTHDDSWPNTDIKDQMNILYVSVTCFNNKTLSVVPGKMFSATEAGKTVLVSNYPIIDFRDKLGRPHFTVTHDATIKAPVISTSQVLINKFNNRSSGSNFSNMFGRQQVGYATSIGHPL